MMRAVAVAIAVAMATPVLAVQPDEILSDPLLEERARELSKGLRCLVCRNESIDESNAELARDLRLLVRERLVAGDSNDEVIEFVVDRYGEYVLLKPLATGANRILYWAAPAMLLLSLGIGSLYIRERRRPEEAVEGLSEDEEERLKEILRK